MKKCGEVRALSCYRHLLRVVVFAAYVHVSTFGFSLFGLGSVAFAQANSAQEIHALGVGESMPDGVLLTKDGKKTSLRKVVGNKKAVVIFFRGGWCPYCSLHLADLQKVESELRGLGYQIIAISPDSVVRVRENIDRASLTYGLFSDPGLELAKKFGIAYRVSAATHSRLASHGIDLEKESGESHRLLPVPAAFLIDGNGIVRFQFADADYKVRIKSAELLREASSIEAKEISAKETSK